ncbi:MAG TPA: hypothetical protein VF057_04940, partial [Thermoanaerobaculia bacterium]
MTGLLFTATFFPLAGAAIRRLCGGGPRFLLGIGVTGVVLYIALLLRVPPQPVLIAMAVASIATLIFARRRDSEPEQPRSVFATMVTIAPIVALLFVTAIVPLADYDGRAFWVLKAKAIASERAVDGPFFSGERGHNPKNEYPLLIPLAASAVMTATNSLDDFGIRWIYVLALGSFALHARRWIGVWPAALIAWIPQFASHAAQTAYNDIFVAAFAAMAFFELADRRSAVRFGLWISFLALTKNEGLPFALLLLVLGAVVWRREVLRGVAPFAVALLTLFVWRLRVEPTDDDPLVALLPTLGERLERLIPAVTEFAGRAFEFGRWGLFWFAVLAAAVMLVVRGRWREVALPSIVIAGMTAAYVAAYMVTPWRLTDH